MSSERSENAIFPQYAILTSYVRRSFALKESPKELKEASSKQMAMEDGGKKKKKGGGMLSFEENEEKLAENEKNLKRKGLGGGEEMGEDGRKVKKKRTAHGSFTPKMVEFINTKHKPEKPKEKVKEVTVGDNRKKMIAKANNLMGLNAM